MTTSPVRGAMVLNWYFFLLPPSIWTYQRHSSNTPLLLRTPVACALQTMIRYLPTTPSPLTPAYPSRLFTARRGPEGAKQSQRPPSAATEGESHVKSSTRTVSLGASLKTLCPGLAGTPGSFLPCIHWHPSQYFAKYSVRIWTCLEISHMPTI